jgi:hypothetical protein
MQDIISDLNSLRESTQVVLQWIPSHCGIDGNEMADSLSRVGSDLVQHSVNFCEAKTIIRNRRRTEWRHRLHIDNNLDTIFLLPRRAQTLIFRFQTGHCRLRAHLYRLGLIHTDACSCRNGIKSTQLSLRVQHPQGASADDLVTRGERAR